MPVLAEYPRTSRTFTDAPVCTAMRMRQVLATLARRLRVLRVEHGYTQVSLARAAQLTPAAVRRFERRGLISLDRFIRYATAVGVDCELASLFFPRRVNVPPQVLGRRVRGRQRGWEATRRRGRV